MRILGIETSCDETAVALVDDGKNVICNVILSSLEEFTETGGVVPELAARKQVEYLMPALREALKQGKSSWNDIDAIAVAVNPGLMGSLLVGMTAARTLGSIHKKPVLEVDHVAGHLSSIWLEREPGTLQFPVITLSVSGGHTELWLRQSHTENIKLGGTRDDAAGEAFDKGAQLLGLPYPGGPEIARLATKGDATAYDLPLPLRGEDTLDFSFSGLKTALRYQVRDLGGLESLSNKAKANLAASYQTALCLHLTTTLSRALEAHPEVVAVHLVGGVGANLELREKLTASISQRPLITPVKPEYCTDNAAMIAAAGYFESRSPQTPTS